MARSLVVGYLWSLSRYGAFARSAKFTLAYTRAGLVPDGSSTYFLPRLVGLRRAKELIFTNRVLNAEEALDWQLINQVLDDDLLQDEA